MGFIECVIAAAEADPTIDAKPIVADYKNKIADYKKEGFSSAESSRLAASDLLDERQDLVSFNREQLDNVDKFKKLSDNINNLAKEMGIGKKEASNLYLETIFSSIHGEQHKALRVLADVSNELKVNWVGTRNKSFLDEVGRMLFAGKFDGSKAGQVAKALRQMEILTSLDFTAAGGKLTPRKNFISESHNPAKMRRKKGETVIEARDRWIAVIDKTHSVHSDIDGRLVTDPVKKRELLEMSYDSISTRGRNKRDIFIEEGELPPRGGRQSYGGRRTHKKILYAKDYDSWLEYNSLYGRADSVIDGLIQNSMSMARETAVLKHLGTDPDRIRDAIKDIIGAEDGKFSSGKMLDSKFQVLTGRGLHSAQDGWSSFVGGTANLMRSATLGMGGFSALPDSVFVRSTAIANGLNTSRVTKNYVKSALGGGKQGKELANRTGYMADSILGTLHLAERDSGVLGKMINSSHPTSGLASLTNNLSGLAHITNIGRMTMHLESMATALEVSKVGWKKLSPNLRESLASAGVGQKDWSLLNALKDEDFGLFAKDGSIGVIDTGKLRAMDNLNKKGIYDLADKLDSWSATLQQVATNEGNLTSKAITQGDFLFTGRTAKVAFLMYKTFPLSVLFNHTIPAIKNAYRGKPGSYKVLSHVLVYSTVLGNISLAMKDVAKGLTPRDNNDPKTWLLSFLAGGGGGLVSDLLNPRHQSFGRSTGDILVGPPAGLAFDAADTATGALGGIYSLLYEGDTRAFEKSMNKTRKKSVSMLGTVTPLKNIWFGRMAIDRLFFDGLRRWADENYDSSNKRYLKRLREDGGRRPITQEDFTGE